MGRFLARLERIEREVVRLTTCTGAVRRKVMVAAGGAPYRPDPAADTCPRCGTLGCGVLVIAKKIVSANREPVEAR